jgi:hypothetical protein
MMRDVDNGASNSRWGLALVGLVTVMGCRQHVLTPGSYSLAATQVLRDDCGLVAESPWSAQLQIPGDNVWLTTTSVFGIQMRGLFKTNVESFYVDGDAANVQAQVLGQPCTLAFVNLHLDGNTVSSTAFSGVFQILYDVQGQVPDRCTCQLWVNYQATAQ